jgi:ATP-binding cassette subfamily B protein
MASAPGEGENTGIIGSQRAALSSPVGFQQMSLMEPRAHSSRLSDLLIRLWNHLTPRRRRQFVLLTFLTPVSALAEVVSLGAVLPFLGVLIAPGRVFKQPLIANLAHRWDIVSADQLVLPLTVGFIGAALIAGLIRLSLLWISTRLAFASGSDLSVEVYRRTLYQPYSVHIARNSGVVVSGILNSVNNAAGVLLSMLTLLSSVVLLVAVTLALIAIDPLMALVATAGFGALYRLITWMTRWRLVRNSTRIADEHLRVVRALQEGLGGIRDVLLDGTQPVYCEAYGEADRRLRRAFGNNNFIGQSPRFAMEALGMILLALLAYGASYRPGGVAAALPALGALALGAQRLLPALQQVYSSWANIVGSRASLADAIDLLDQPLPDDISAPAPNPLAFRDSIRFEAVRFRYAAEAPWALDGLNLEIRKGDRVGFVGSTGSGKSTAFDLLMGLLRPTDGSLFVDGQRIEGDRVGSWQRVIAHVPQSIYLADATIGENIAFGVPRELIDLPRMRRAAQQAQIADVIEQRPEGYDAIVGERGIRFSGGQRQRIGIARALYKQASVLVFDEATSALDNATEQSVIEAIHGLSRDLTILLIAHRLSSVRRCDVIVELEHGRIVAQGSYQYLLEHSPSFRRMAHAAA